MMAEAIGWKYYLFFVVVLIAECVFLYTFLVETKGKSLEETAVLFDDPVEAEENEMTVRLLHPASPVDYESEEDS